MMKCLNWTSILSEIELDLTEGVYLFLGYSEKDEQLLKAVTGQGIFETIGEIEGLVRYHNINNNKVGALVLIKNNSFQIKVRPKDVHQIFRSICRQSECRVVLHKQSGENIILQAIMEEFQENRDSGNLTNYLLNKEKVRIIRFTLSIFGSSDCKKWFIFTCQLRMLTPKQPQI